MEIKPIKRIPKVQKLDLPDTRIDRNLPRIRTLLKPAAGKWVFKNGQILFKGQDVGKLLEQAGKKPTAFWSSLAAELEVFRNYYIRKKGKKRKRKVQGKVVVELVDPSGELGRLSALVDAYIGKIMRLIKRKYDETADGLSYCLDDDGQLTLNGMNVNAFIDMARRYPSDKARKFLKGLKNRLGIILSNKSHNPNYDKIKEATDSLFNEIDQEIEKIVEKERLIENT